VDGILINMVEEITTKQVKDHLALTITCYLVDHQDEEQELLAMTKTLDKVLKWEAEVLG